MNEWRRYMFLNFSLHVVYDKNGTVKHFYINIYLNVKVVNSKCTSEPAWYPHFVSQIYLSQHLHVFKPTCPQSIQMRWRCRWIWSWVCLGSMVFPRPSWSPLSHRSVPQWSGPRWIFCRIQNPSVRSEQSGADLLWCPHRPKQYLNK